MSFTFSAFSVKSSGGDRYHPQLVSSDFMPDAASPRALPRQSPFLPPPHPPRPIDHFGLPGRQWSPQRHPQPPPPPHYLKASGARAAAAAAAAEMHHMREQRKASTMDGDKRRLFLDRMRNNGHFHNLTSTSEAAAAAAAAAARSRSNESSYRVRPSESFYMREAMSGFRSLSTDSRAAARGNVLGLSSSQQPQSAVIGLFCDEEDEPPLQMSSVDGGGGGGGGGRCMRRRVIPTGSDVIDTVDDCSPTAMAAPGCDAFATSCSGQFSLSTPDFGVSRQHPQHGQGDQQQGHPPQQLQLLQQQQQSSQKGINGGSSSYSSLRNKIKSVQERYKKSSVTNRFRAKFGAKQGDISPTRNPAPNIVLVGPAASSSSSVSLEVSKFRSHSHGALHSLNEFQQKIPSNNEAVDGDLLVPQDWSGKKNETVTTTTTTTTTATVEPLPKSSLASSASSASSSGSNPSTPRLTTSTPKASSSSSSSSSSTAAVVLKKKNKGMSMMGKSKSTEAVSAVGDIDEVRR